MRAVRLALQGQGAPGSYQRWSWSARAVGSAEGEAEAAAAPKAPLPVARPAMLPCPSHSPPLPQVDWPSLRSRRRWEFARTLVPAGVVRRALRSGLLVIRSGVLSSPLTSCGGELASAGRRHCHRSTAHAWLGDEQEGKGRRDGGGQAPAPMHPACASTHPNPRARPHATSTSTHPPTPTQPHPHSRPHPRT